MDILKKVNLNKRMRDINIKMATVFAVALFIVGCTSVIVKDEAPPPIENGLNRVETIACGHHGVGNNICWVSPSDDPRNVSIETVIYFEGRLVIKSIGGGCSIDDSVTVSGFGLYRLDLAKYVSSFSKSCIIDLIYQPKFPGQEESDAKIRGASGRVLLMVSPLDKAELSDGAVAYSRPQDDLFYEGSGLISIRQTRDFVPRTASCNCHLSHTDHVHEGARLDDAERRQWILNDEGLYRWAKAERVRI